MQTNATRLLILGLAAGLLGATSPLKAQQSGRGWGCGGYAGGTQADQRRPYRAGYGQYAPSGNGRANGNPNALPSIYQAPLHIGDRVQPADEKARLMKGAETLALVPRGEVLPVLEVRGPWVGTRVDQDGREVQGWIHIDQLAPVASTATRMR